MPLQEIIDWLGQKDEELSAQLPLRGDVLLVQQEKETHAVRSPAPCLRLPSLVLTGTSRFPEQKSLTRQAARQRLQLEGRRGHPNPNPNPNQLSLVATLLRGTLLLPSSLPQQPDPLLSSHSGGVAVPSASPRHARGSIVDKVVPLVQPWPSTPRPRLAVRPSPPSRAAALLSPCGWPSCPCTAEMFLC